MAKAVVISGVDVPPGADVADRPTHYVDWGAIIAGAFVATAISTIFIAFGSAIGLSLVSPYRGESAPATALVIAAALWLLWVQVSGFLGGGYLAGRMRRRIGDAKPDEVEIRDGSHGLLVWAVGVVMMALLAGWTALAGLSGIASIAGNAAASSTDSMAYYADSLLRGGAQPPATATAPAAPAADDTQRQEIGRILGRGVTTLSADDKSYLARLVAAQTGLPEAEAQQRVDQTLATIQAQAETARKAGIVAAFLAAASLLVSAVAAWWAATMGGKHRDEGIDHSRLTAWR